MNNFSNDKKLPSISVKQFVFLTKKKTHGNPKAVAETFPSSHSFIVIVKKSKHKLLLLQSYQNLLCSDMCSGLKINDLVISPSRPFCLSMWCFIYLPPEVLSA